MTTTYSQSLLLIEPGVADPATTNAWGTLLNTDMSLIDSSVTGILDLSVAGNSNVILTSVAGQADQARNVSFVFTGALTGNILVLWPNALPRNFRVYNNTSGAYTLTCAVNNGSGAAAGSTYAVPQGTISFLSSDGTNITQYLTDGSQFANLPGVASFNTRTGTVTLGSSDVTTALGYTPVNKAGDTMSSYLTISSGAAAASLVLDANAGELRQLVYYTESTARWRASADNEAESGANAGTNYVLDAFNDAGSFLGNAYAINRATQVTAFAQIPTFGTATALSANTQAANTAYCDGAVATAKTALTLPSGAMMMYAATTAPSGWLLCNGAAVSRTTYAALYAAIGTAYGAGDGSTTFNLPDMRGNVPAGYDPSNASGRLTDSTAQGVSAAALGNAGGEQAHTQILAEIATHGHTTTQTPHTHTTSGGSTITGAGGTVIGGSGYATTALTINTASITLTVNNAGSSQAFNVVQPTLIVNFIIKT